METHSDTLFRRGWSPTSNDRGDQMSISNQRELQVSLSKLAVLEGDIQKLVASEPNVAMRRAMEITLSRLINQFKEEIGRYQAGARRNLHAERALRNEQQAKNT